MLQNNGFDVVPYERVDASTVEPAVLRFQNNIKENDFATDGLVIGFDDKIYSKSLGETAKFPRDALAFKWRDETMETTLTEVLWSPSRSGRINPIAVFDPVELDSTTVSRASLHNVSIVEGLQLGIGDTVTVYKANMIIPQVAENLTQSGTVSIPEHCPACGNATELLDENGIKFLLCPAPNCPAKTVLRMAHFVARDAMNIEGFSEQTIEKLVDIHLLRDASDIFTLHEHRATIETMPGFGKKSCDNLLQSIENARTCALYQFLFALGIEHVGLANAKALCAHFNNDLDRIRSATTEDLISIDGFGESIAHSIVRYFGDTTCKTLVQTILPYLTFIKEETATHRPLHGQTIAITGDLVTMSRKELTAWIETRGGKVSSSVSKKTAYLVNNDTTSASSKNVKAQQAGVPILSETQFFEIVAQMDQN